MSKENPTDFKDLDASELYRSAVEDFALPVEEEEKGKKKVLLAAFAEGGVTWEAYLEQHPDLAPKGSVITLSSGESNGLTVNSEVPVEPENKWADDERSAQVAAQPEPRILVKEPTPVANPTDKYLIKMVRDNPLFEVRGYRFTSEHPYALVDARDAQYILEVEEGFRQAFPNELEEFYG